MSWRCAIVLTFTTFLVACGSGPAPPPYLMFRGLFNPDKIACTETVVRDISRKWKFQVIEKNKKEPRIANGGVAGFSMFIIAKDGDPNDGLSWVMGIGSYIKSSSISLLIHDTDMISNSDKDRLADEVVSRLRKECNVNLTSYTES